MLSRTTTFGTLNTKSLLYQSVRYVHWYHDPNFFGNTRDNHEVYTKKPEFGQDEITDKDRYPHLYWNLWKGRTSIERVVDQWAYSKDLKPEKARQQAEKLKYFYTLDALNFLEGRRTDYQFLDDNARGAVGYLSEENADVLLTHQDFGKLYCDASEEYKTAVLQDPCDGRPVYEWQVPYGLDEAYGYKDVSTAVDVLGNEDALKNTSFEWKEGASPSTEVVLKHPQRKQEVILCSEENAAKVIAAVQPQTVVFQRGAELLLSSVSYRFSPTCVTDLNGCALASAWSAFFYASPLWPEPFLVSGVLGMGLLFANYRLWREVVMSHNELKAAFRQCRQLQCNVVLGDWMADDFEERKNYVQKFDNFAAEVHHPKHKDSTHGSSSSISSTGLHTSPAVEYAKSLFTKSSATLDTNTKESHGIQTYMDAIINRRIDILAHVINNVEGEKIVVPIRKVDTVPMSWVSKNLMSKLTGANSIGKPPLKFDTYYERVEVAF